MALINLSLLFGGLGVAVPIVLHLTMRRQPRRLPFPAVRFLQQRRESNQRQLQLRHWFLLMLRCLAIAVLAGALARPSVAAGIVGGWAIVAIAGFGLLLVALATIAAAFQRRERGLVIGLAAASIALTGIFGFLLWRTWRSGSPQMLGDQEAPVAAVLILDAAPRMDYRFENRTRLEQARGTAQWLLEQLPEGSDIAVVDTHPGAPLFALDRAAARQAVDRIRITGATEPIAAVLERAIPWLEQSTKLRREVYVMTDLTAGAWPTESSESLKSRLASAADVQLYVIDVGVSQPRNAGLGPLKLSQEILPRSGELELSVDLSTWGVSGERTVELLVEEADPTLPILRDGHVELPRSVSRGRQVVQLTADGSQVIQFKLRGWSAGVHHGRVQLTGEDGLPADDARYFTLEVEESRQVLLVAGASAITRYLSEAIAPDEFRQAGQARFECKEVPQAAFDQQNLKEFAAVCLLDPQPLTPDQWRRLAQFVTDGGSLAVFLGHNAQAGDSFADPAAQQLLGGKLARQWRSGAGDLFLAPNNFEHPITREFRALATSVPWDHFPIYRHWEFDPFGPQTRTVIAFGNRQPALVETTVGRGRVVTMTTPVSDPVRPRGRTAWNELPTAPDAWPFVMLADQMVNYLAGQREVRLNYRAGETAVLTNPEGEAAPRFQLFTPSDDTQEVVARAGRLTVKSTEQPGSYRLKGFREEPIALGFSVNLDPGATNLTRVSSTQLDEALGAGRYRLATSRAEIDRGIGEARVGREFFPILMLALAGVFALEQLLANRFYGAKKT